MVAYLVKKDGRWIADVHENGFEYTDDEGDARLFGGVWLLEWQGVPDVEIVRITIDLIRGDN